MDFPPMFFHLGDYDYKMTPDHYIVETWSGRNRFCYFLVQGSDIKKNSILLGDAFLRNYYVFHDVDNKRIGMYGDYMIYHGSKFGTREWMLLFAAVFAILGIFALGICLC
jgi:hypothetical protein